MGRGGLRLCRGVSLGSNKDNGGARKGRIYTAGQV